MAAGVGSQHSIHKCRSSSAGPQAAEQPQRHYCSSLLRFPSASTLSSRNYSKWYCNGMQPEQCCCPTWSLCPLCCPTRPPEAYLSFRLNALFMSLHRLPMGVRVYFCTGAGSASNTQPTCCKWHSYSSPSTGPATEAITSPCQGAHA